MKYRMFVIVSGDTEHCIDQALVIVPESDWASYDPYKDDRIADIVIAPQVAGHFDIPADAYRMLSEIGEDRPYFG